MGTVKTDIPELELEFIIEFVTNNGEAILRAHRDLGLSLSDCICAVVRKSEAMRIADPRQRTLELVGEEPVKSGRKV